MPLASQACATGAGRATRKAEGRSRRSRQGRRWPTALSGVLSRALLLGELPSGCAPRRALCPAPRRAPRHTPRRAPSHAPRRAPRHAPGCAPHRTPPEVARAAARQAPQRSRCSGSQPTACRSPASRARPGSRSKRHAAGEFFICNFEF